MNMNGTAPSGINNMDLARAIVEIEQVKIKTKIWGTYGICIRFWVDWGKSEGSILWIIRFRVIQG